MASHPSATKGRRWLPILVTAVVVGVVAGVGGYVLGQRNADPPAATASPEFVRNQQSAVVNAILDSNQKLVTIQQQTAELLTGKSGREIDTDAFHHLRTQYTEAYDQVLTQLGRARIVFSDQVNLDLKAISQADNGALRSLYPDDPSELLSMTAADVSAMLAESHSARKAQWNAIRRFSQDATAEMVGSQESK